MKSGKNKPGVALVGLGKYSTKKLAPALQQAKHCKLAGIVTGSPEKADAWKNKYRLSENSIYNYDNFDSIAENKEVDIVYVVLPNAMHEAFTARAAAAGKHVICEKPMATTAEACRNMIKACKDAGVKLSIGYRLHFEPYNLEMRRLAKENTFGDIRKIKAGFGFVIGKNEWRLDHHLAGGGPLVDVGIYCIQAACYLTGKTPIAVAAQEGEKTKPEKFKSVEQRLTWQMEFDNGVTCECRCAYDENIDFYEVEVGRGKMGLQPAFGYADQQGYTPDGTLHLENEFEQVLQLDNFALAIKENRDSPVPGEMGLRDVEIIQSIYRAMRTGEKQKL